MGWCVSKAAMRPCDQEGRARSQLQAEVTGLGGLCEYAVVQICAATFGALRGSRLWAWYAVVVERVG